MSSATAASVTAFRLATTFLSLRRVGSMSTVVRCKVPVLVRLDDGSEGMYGRRTLVACSQAGAHWTLLHHPMLEP